MAPHQQEALRVGLNTAYDTEYPPMETLLRQDEKATDDESEGLVRTKQEATYNLGQQAIRQANEGRIFIGDDDGRRPPDGLEGAGLSPVPTPPSESGEARELPRLHHLSEFIMGSEALLLV